MTPQEIINQLQSDGWREYPNHLDRGRRMFCKSFDNHAECKCNERKRKQLEIYFRDREEFHGHVFEAAFVAECTGQLPSNQWLRMRIESLRTIDEINFAVNSLLAAWDASVAKTANIKEVES